MLMHESMVKRLNELAAKDKTPEGLTVQEKIERATLRAKYIEVVKRNLNMELDATYILENDGTKRPLARKPEFQDKD